VSISARFDRLFGRPHLRLIAFVGLFVPRRLRADWRQEWEAELRCREALLADWDRLDWRGKLDLLRRSAAAFRDALWLQTYRWEDDMIQDIRFGFRMLLRDPGVTAIAVVTLALGMGANTAIFSVVNAVLLRALPYQETSELMALYVTDARGEGHGPVSPVTYLNLKRQNGVFSDLAAISAKGWPANLTGDGEPERMQGFQVSANLFATLGVAAAEGRTFLDEEDRPGNNRVVVLSHDFWQRRFGGDAGVIDRAVTLNGEAYTVVGVMPADFRFFTKTDAWTPLAFTPSDERDEAGYLAPVGRLGPGVSTEQARAEIASLYRSQLANPNSESHVNLKPLQALMAEEARPMLWILFAAVGFVLLIACANVANLLLMRGAVRRRELAIRAALGAGRLRVVRQLLVESAMLAVMGGACGLLLAHWCIRFLVAGLPEHMTAPNAHLAMLTLDGRALGFTFALALLTTVVFGLLPALHASKSDLNETLKESGRGEARGGGQGRLRSTLVVTEIALAMILLVGAGLMLKSFWRLSHVDPGFSSAGVLTAKIDPAMEFPRTVTFYRQLLERLGAVPGVQHAGIVNSLDSSWPFTIDEHPPVPEEKRPSAANNQVSEDYFRAMGMPLREGRFFDARDTDGAPKVAIVDATLAERHFPGESPVGKHIHFIGASREIVGVVGAARFYDLSAMPSPHVYVPYRQENWGSMSLTIRVRAGDPTALIPVVRRELAAIDGNMPVHSFQTLEAAVDEWNAPQRFSTSLLTAFGALAALLAAVGIYGVLAYSVAQRAHEIGVRMALGADRGDVFRLVVGQGMRTVAVGLLAGTLGALALTRWMESLLFEVQATDPSTYVWICVLLAVVAMLACCVPARRATKTDPIVALRHE
jgi:putative ABC transport system permease protein